MKTNYKILFTLFANTFIFFLLFDHTGAATLSWEQVNVTDLEGYVIHCGTESGHYTMTYDVGNVEQYEMQDLDAACTYYFTVSAYDAWGNHSGYSPEIMYRASTASDDTEPPELVEVRVMASNQLALCFDEPLCAQSAQNASNYSIFPGVTVLEAMLEEDGSTVRLTTSVHGLGDYLIAVSNILDRAPTPNRIPDNTSLGYTVDATAVAGRTGHLPSEFSLSQNFPNPFNPRTNIEYSVKNPGHVRLQIYNVRGELVKTLIDQDVYSAGKQAPVSWDATNEMGMPVASGFYIYRLESGGRIATRRMQFIR